MNETIRLGHIAGIRIGVNWTVLVVVLLIVWGTSTIFADWYPNRDPVEYAVAGLVAAVLFFLSLLAHEIAHAIVAQRNGIRCDGIVLWLFGGVAKLASEPRDPGTDLRVAAVGPLVSLLLAVVFGAVGGVAAALGVGGLELAVLGWLAMINLVLAVFNLVPAAPLDGGRILRALLWRWRGNRAQAAVAAARAGRFFGFALVGLGLARVVFGDLGGLWFVLIGWFIAMAANAEEQHVRFEDALAGISVGDVMSPQPVSVPPSLTVEQLLDDYVWRTRYSAFPVVDSAGRPLGLITLNRLKQVAPERRREVYVGEIAAPPEEIIRASPTQALTEVLHGLGASADARILAIDDDRVVGIVSPRDIARTFELAELRDQPAGR